MRIHYVACGVNLAESSGGPIIHVVEAIDQLRELGYDVELLGLYSRRPDFLGCRWRGLTMSRLRVLRYMINSWRLLLLLLYGGPRAGHSVLYIRWGTSALVICLFARLMRIHYWVEMNGIYRLARLQRSGGPINRMKGALSEWFEKRCLAGAAGVFTTTAKMADYYARVCGLDRSRIVPNPCGVNPAIHHLSVSQRVERGGDAPPVVGFAGGLWHQSGIDTLIESAPQVVERFPDVRFKIIGSSDQAQLYEKKAHERGIFDHFDFVGRVPYFEVSPQLEEVDVAVAPYNNTANLEQIGGGSPQKIYSYLACGKITIISDLPYYAHFRQCPACLFIRPGDPQDLARVIVEALSIEPALARELGRLARQYVLDHYTWRHNAQRIRNALSITAERNITK